MPNPSPFAESAERVGADPESGISLGHCTNGFDRDAIRQSRRGVALPSRAAACALD